MYKLLNTHDVHTKDILYSCYKDDWRYKTTLEIHGYVNCQHYHNDQFIGILDYTDLTEEQFKEKYKGHIREYAHYIFSSDIKYRSDFVYKLVFVI